MTPGVLAGVFLASLLGSLHCAGMCGPLLAVCVALPDERAPRWVAHAVHALGRLLTYAALGAAAGTLGAGIDLAGAWAGVGKSAAVAAGIVVVLAGAHGVLAAYGVRVPPRGTAPRRLALWIASGIAALRAQPPVARAALVGLLSAGLPCGWLWAFVVVAAGTGGAAQGALTMTAFWAGTVPSLAVAGVVARMVSAPWRRHVPVACSVLLVALGLATVLSRAAMLAPVRVGTAAPAACHAPR